MACQIFCAPPAIKWTDREAIGRPQKAGLAAYFSRFARSHTTDWVGFVPRSFSIFLDAARLCAALAVLFGHLTQTSGGVLPRLAIEHDGVVVFFVLSGYVIGYCAHERERELPVFAVARIARVFSVAVPALLLTMVLDRTGIAFNRSAYPYAFEFRKWYVYLPLFWGFLSELWLLKISAFSNTPYWSLVYEVWYYIAFACVFFLRGRPRVAWSAGVIAIMGLKIWLLAPLWLAGYALYRLQRHRNMNAAAAAALAATALIAYLAVKRLNLDGALDGWADHMSGGWIHVHLSGSQFFLGDLLKGLCVFLFFLGMRYCVPRAIEMPALARPIRYCAQFTFSLYLFHFPVLVFLAALFPPSQPADQLLRLAAVGLLVLTLGGWCERQKDRLRRAMLARALSPSLP